MALPTEDVPYEASVAAATFCMLGMVQALPRMEAYLTVSAEEPVRGAHAGIALMGLHGTPLDPLLGDAAVAANGRHLLIEFKRHRDLLATELGKPRRDAYLQTLRASKPQPIDRNDLVMRAHAVVYTNPAASGPRIVASPYAVLAALLDARRITPATPHDLETFCRIFLDIDVGVATGKRALLRVTEPQWGTTWPEFQAYLTQFVAPVAPGAGSSGTAARALVLDDIAGYWLVATANGRLAGEAFRGPSDLQRLMALAQAGGQPPPSAGPQSPGPAAPRPPNRPTPRRR